MDPNEVIGTPREYTVWLAPDWSDYDEKRSKGTGWTNVSVKETLYADGRIVRQVLDENRAPITTRLLDATPQIDKAQEKRFNDAKTQAAKGDQEGDTRGPQNGQTREVYRGGKWVTEANPLYQDQNGGGWHTEGTPDGNGGYDNSRPIMVRTVNGKREERSLSEEELRKWRADQQASQPQTGEVKRPVEGRPGWTSITRTTVQGGNKTEETVFIGPDGKEVRTLPDKPPTAAERVGSPTGNTRQRVENGQTIKEAEYVLPNGTKEWRSQTAPNPDATPDPTGAPPPSFNIGDAAEDLRKYDEWLAQQIGTGPGKISVARADQLREQRRKMWQVALDEKQNIVNTQQAEASRQTNERGQTLQDQGNRRSSATQIANQASNDFMSLATKLGSGGGGADLMQAIADTRAGAQDFVTMTGANRVVPPTQTGPALSAVNAMPLNPRPNAIGLGQGGTIFRPQPVVPPSAIPATPPAAVPTAPQGASRTTDPAQGGGPAFRPAAPAPAPTQAGLERPDDLLDFAADSASPAETMTRAAFDAMTPSQQAYYRSRLINARSGSSGPAPATMPSGQMLAPGVPSPVDQNGSATVFEPVPPVFTPGTRVGPGGSIPAGPAGGGNVQMMPTAAPGFLSAMRPGSQPTYDPTPAAHALIADPNWDNEAVKEAYRQLYGRELQVA